MGRQKTISDEEVLRVARDLFRAQGHTVTTREIAEASGISEAVLYQRFGSKDDLFFAAMHPHGPDVEALLGPKDPPDEAHVYLRTVVVRLGKYFADVIPLALRVMTHPSFEPARLPRPRMGGQAVLRDGLTERIATLQRRKQLAPLAAGVIARLLLSLAHDWALGCVFSSDSPAHRERELKEMVEAVWQGLRPR